MILANFNLCANQATVGMEVPQFYTCVGYTDKSVFKLESFKNSVQTFSKRRLWASPSQRLIPPANSSQVVGQMTIARWHEALCAISNTFSKGMTRLTEGLADDDHGLIFIVEISFSNDISWLWMWIIRCSLQRVQCNSLNQQK